VRSSYIQKYTRFDYRRIVENCTYRLQSCHVLLMHVLDYPDH
jgi:hypothetical protein